MRINFRNVWVQKSSVRVYVYTMYSTYIGWWRRNKYGIYKKAIAVMHHSYYAYWYHTLRYSCMCKTIHTPSWWRFNDFVCIFKFFLLFDAVHFIYILFNRRQVLYIVILVYAWLVVRERDWWCRYYYIYELRIFCPMDFCIRFFSSQFVWIYIRFSSNFVQMSTDLRIYKKQYRDRSIRTPNWTRACQISGICQCDMSICCSLVCVSNFMILFVFDWSVQDFHDIRIGKLHIL